MSSAIRRPVLVPHARYRWDKLRQQHQLVFPEGILVLNEPGAAIVQRCDGRPLAELLVALGEQFPDANLGEDVQGFLERLARKGLLRDATDS
ncbi:MAG: pyrroloquinoline quinone biosynthesis peptide chaperone PqqD [Planctomycetes bacterium]|nr:pyrroloquinoline quinone biosynthesis peptide chaperone PqqD [Planctomycetota bacterium]